MRAVEARGRVKILILCGMQNVDMAQQTMLTSTKFSQVRAQLGFKVYGVSMKGCAGARSTQARTPTCRSPPRWRSTFALAFDGFRVLSNSDRAPVFFFVFRTCLGQAGARFGWVWLEASCLEACKP